MSTKVKRNVLSVIIGFALGMVTLFIYIRCGDNTEEPYTFEAHPSCKAYPREGCPGFEEFKGGPFVGHPQPDYTFKQDAPIYNGAR